ncbi:uncharacterized protein LOC128388618 isoform X2 [Panonychus citri]|uniref:uncharacterized protein LOC128388618 isoform X2 n=1 Tax=Panonychus citri TaxID=50023 RepID=UPI002306F5C6|nr:uncharacterized protein LOC128388618 isoform X2 [Panonychus citri]
MSKQSSLIILHLVIVTLIVMLIVPCQVNGFKKLFYKKLIKAGILGKLLLGGKKVIIAFPMPIPMSHEMSSPWGNGVGFGGGGGFGGGSWPPSMWNGGGWGESPSPWSF